MVKASGRRWLVSRFFQRVSGLDRVIILSCLFSIALTFSRVFHTGSLLFVSLIWNLFLAFIPYYISQTLSLKPGWIKNRLWFAVLFVVWLLFLPNSFYIITDLFHLHDRKVITLWFDLALILSFTWNGLLFGILSVRHMERILEKKWGLRHELFFIYPLMLLNAFGIFVGRYLRFNSWDVIANPFELAGDIISLVIHPLRNRFDWGMILCFSVFLTLIYLSMKRMGKDLAA